MEKSKKAKVLCSSRLKLSWLLLLTCTGLVLYSYFEYYYSNSVIVHRHLQSTRDARKDAVSHSRTLSNSSHGSSISSITAAAEPISTTRNAENSTVSAPTTTEDVDAQTTESVLPSLSQAYTQHYNIGNEVGKTLTQEGSNEAEVDAFIDEFAGENEENFGSDFLPEMGSEGNESESYLSATDDPGATYETSTGEFGVVFADQENGDTSDEEEEPQEGGVNEEGEGEGERVEQDAVNGSNSDGFEIPHLLKDIRNTSRDVVGQSRDTHSSKSPKEIYGETLLQHIHASANHSNPHCSVSSAFHSWENRIVSEMGAPLIRDCHKMRQNPFREIKRSKLKSQLSKWKSHKPWETFALKYKEMSCAEIREDFQNNFYVSQLEKEFPIAYIFVVYTNAGQVLRLLKSIYRPHNLYCIHPDARQGEKFAQFFKAVARCLDNVFVVSRPVKVYYGHISITDAQLHCMSDLARYRENRWKYVINLCGREVPLKTNREIVESLQKMRGYTVLKLRRLTPIFWDQRFRYKYKLNRRGQFGLTRSRQGKPPKGIKLYKSMNFMAASRAFVKFLLHSTFAGKLRKYLGSVFAPEEHFYSSLYALKQAKGARPPSRILGKYDMPTVDAFIWVNNRWEIAHRKKYCPGRKIVHGICILSAPDMSNIDRLGLQSKHPVFFFNKYFLEWDPTPMECMEERLVRTNMEEYRRDCFTSGHQRSGG